MKMKVVVRSVENNVINIEELKHIGDRLIVCYNAEMNWVWLLVRKDGRYRWVCIEDSISYDCTFNSVKEAIETDNCLEEIEHYVFGTRTEFGAWLASIGEVGKQ